MDPTKTVREQWLFAEALAALNQGSFDRDDPIESPAPSQTMKRAPAPQSTVSKRPSYAFNPMPAVPAISEGTAANDREVARHYPKAFGLSALLLTPWFFDQSDDTHNPLTLWWEHVVDCASTDRRLAAKAFFGGLLGMVMSPVSTVFAVANLCRVEAPPPLY